MSKIALALVFALLCSAAPVRAEDEQPAEKKVTTQTRKTTEKSTKTSETLGAVGNATLRGASTAAGTILGLPIAAGRMFARADVEQAKSIPFIGESQSGVRMWVSRAIVLPTATFSGIVVAPFCSAVNAWKASEDKPFSKEAFCLGQLDESVSPN